MSPLTNAADVDEFVRQARAALKKGDAAAAMEAARKAVEADPKVPTAVFIRGEAYAAQRKHAEAIKDYEAALALDKTYPRRRRPARRGAVQARPDPGVDRRLQRLPEAFPKDEPGHWRRGISFYYAGKYAEGAKQFYDGRVVFGADVENAFWHFLCNARKDGVEKARKDLLALDGAGQARSDDAHLRHASGEGETGRGHRNGGKGEARRRRRRPRPCSTPTCTSALYFEADGDADMCKEHLTAAVEKYKIGHYMWDVANVHLARMKKK